jgi:acyl transferase domain-containing protein/NAD(P)-dependent dehydrogenase (short-subunit alcohol dehydrogenase family)
MSDAQIVDSSDSSAEESSTFDIAVTGLALRFPGASTPDEFWRNLITGTSSIRRFTDQELSDSGVTPDVLGDPRYVPVSGYLAGAGAFDTDLFGIPRAESRVIDPQHRLFLECAWDAIEDAGYDPRRLGGSRVGCYGGTGMAIYSGSRVSSYLSEYLSADMDRLEGLAPLQAFIATQNDHLCMRVSHRLGLRGPSIAVQTACSTGLVAVHLAAQSLLVGETDMALAGSAGVHFPVKRGYFYEPGSILSPDGVCRPFDAEASGTVGGSGAAAVVLRRLEDAVADGDPVWAVIKGSAVNNDGAGRAGYLAPSVEGQQDVIRSAQRMAGVSPSEIGFVEAHGTGTRLGDSIELTALREIFGDSPPASVPVGAVKSSIGHLDTAAGMAGLIKAVLAVHHGQIPGTLNFRAPNTVLAEESCPLKVSSEPVAWPAGKERRLAGVSSLGGGGTNAHLILGAAPAARERADDGPFALALSGRDAKGLRHQAAAYRDHVLANEGRGLADICQTAFNGRPVFSHRAVVIAADHGEMTERLEDLAGGTATTTDHGIVIHESPVNDSAVRPAFLFSGQGSSLAAAVGALQQLPIFAAALEECRDAAPETGRWFELLRRDATQLTSDASTAQPALFAFQYALTQVWAAAGVTPSAVLGHSLGEYAAACASGVMGLDTAMKLVGARGALMDKLCRPTGMLAVMSSQEHVEAILQEHDVPAEIAVVNGDDAVVVGGDADALARTATALGSTVVTIPLETTHGFHTSAMDPMLPAFDAQLRTAVLRQPTVPFEPSSMGNSFPVHHAGYWVDQVRKPVAFAHTFRRLAQDFDLFLEIGPANALTRLGRRATGSTHLVSSLRGDQPRMEHLMQAAGALHVRGVEVNLTAIGGESSRRARTRVPLSQRKREDLWVKRGPATPSSQPKRGHPSHKASSSSSADVLLGELTWVAEETEPQADSSPWHWVVAASPTHRHLESVLAALREAGLGHSVVEPQQVGTFVTGTAVPDGVQAGLLLVPDLDGRPPWRAVVEIGESLRALLTLKGTKVPGRAVVLRCTPDDGAEIQVDAVGEAVAAVVRCARLEHPPCGIETAIIAAEELLVGLPQLLRARDRDVWWYEGRRHCQQIDRFESPTGPQATLEPDGTYVVSGGTGGIGRHVLRWLVARGARHILVISRHGRPEAVELVDELRREGVDVLVASADASDPRQMRDLGQFVGSSMPSIRGVLHLAGVLHDATLVNLDDQDVRAVFKPKFDGVRELLTLTASSDLDFFVAFSSITAIIGSPGQGAYAAANAAMRAEIQHARERGLSGASVISWGPWSGDGMFAANRDQFARNTRILGELDSECALSLLDYVVSSPGLDLVVTQVLAEDEDKALVSLDVNQLAREVWDSTTTQGTSPQEASLVGSLSAKLVATPTWQRRRIVEDHLCTIVSNLLDLPESDIDIDIPLKQFGVDSLSWVRIRNRLTVDLGVDVSATVLYSHPSISALANYILDVESSPAS